MHSGKRLLVLASALIFLGPAIARAAKDDDKYPSAKAAYADAVKFLEKKDYKSAQTPLEAALKLAPDDEYRLRIYNNLMPCYRLLTDTVKMTEACEFTIAKTKENAERSIAARSLTSFMFQRGKLDQARKTYEERVAKDPDDLVGLSMLTAIHRVHYDERDKAAQYKARLEKVEQKRAGELAEGKEKLAKKDADQATGHWKQAAVYWSRAAEPKRALEAAKQAEVTGPEKHGDLLLYYWHAQLADVYLEADAPEDAIRHLEKAIATTKIAGYKKSCEEKLAAAKSKLSDK